MAYGMIDTCRRLPVQADLNGLLVLFQPGSVSQSFIDKACQTISALPKPLIQVVAQNRFVLILSSTMSQVHPELKFQKPRGHSQKSKYDHLGGLCCFETRHIHLTEFKTGGVTKPVTVLRHEFGHALDHSAGGAIGYGNRELSLNYEFNQVFLQDVEEMGSRELEKLSYYIQKRSPAGRSEAFAESVASLLGGGCAEPAYFQRHFPRTVSWVEETVFLPLGVPKTLELAGEKTLNPVEICFSEGFRPGRKELMEQRKRSMDLLLAPNKKALP